MGSPIRVLFNPKCSKCRQAKALLDARELDAELIHYLDQPPTAAELRDIVGKLEDPDPRCIVRTKEALYAELGLESKSDDELYAALAAHPQLIERPIVIHGDRAVVARPPELLDTVL